MDERRLREILNSGEIPPADENARKQAVNLALSAFDEAQRDGQKNRQGFRLLGRLTGRSNTPAGRRPMTRQYVFGGMATVMAVVLAVVTYDVMDLDMRQQDMALVAPQTTIDEFAGGPAHRPAGNEQEKRRSKKPAKNKADESDLRGTGSRVARVDQAAPAEPGVSGGTLRSFSRSLEKSDSGRAGNVRGYRARGYLADRMARSQPRRTGRPIGEVARRQHYEAVGRDRFANVEQGAVKRVADDPVSTFSVDVDTASYSFVRRQLTRGVLPQKNAVRIEELINYFDYDYPLAATRERPFQATVGVMPSPWKKGNKLIHIGIRGYDIDGDEKPRSNLVFLLDVSGSMNAPDKLPLMVNSMKLLLDTLSPDDTVAIVVYAGAAGTVLEPTKVAEKSKILAALDRLRAGGSTAGAAGIRQAYALAAGTFDSKAVNRVILATDGDFNVGITNREELKGFVERKRRTGVFLSVLGFGQGNLNDHLMQILAQNGNGVAAHIDTLNEARKVLVEEASSMLFPIAKDVKIQVEFNPRTVAEYRLIGYETRALRREDFNNDKVDAGDIGAGHTVTAIYEITPVKGGERMIGKSRYQAPKRAAVTTGSATEYAFLKIRYKLPNEDTSTLISTPISVSQEIDGKAKGAAARRWREIRWATAVAAFGQILKGGKYTGSLSYDDVIAMARGAKGEDEFGYRAEFINLVRLARSASALPRN